VTGIATAATPYDSGSCRCRRGWTEDTRVPILVLWQRWHVLLIGCVTSPALLLARGAARAQEIRTRIAARRRRAAIVRQLLTESPRARRLRGAAGIALGYGGSRVSRRGSKTRSALPENSGSTADAPFRGVALDQPSSSGCCRRCKRAASTFARRCGIGWAEWSRATQGWARRVCGTEVALGVVLLVVPPADPTFDYLVSKPAGFDGTHVLTATLRFRTRDTKPATAWCSVRAHARADA